jgi:cobalt-zinc-cadmium efflux system outer membrane protein
MHACLLRLAAAALIAVVLPAYAASPAVDPRRLTFDQAQVLMLERNRELQLARLAVTGAEADVTLAGAAPNPVFSVGNSRMGSGNSDAGPFVKRMEQSVGVSQLFERGNKRELRREVAQHTASAVRIEQYDVARQQRIALAQAYYDLLLAQERGRIAAETASTFDNTLDAAQRRVKAGDLSRSDLSRITVDALRARNEAQAIALERDKAQLALAYLIGLERDAKLINAGDAWPPLQPPSTPNVDRIVDQRADVKAAQERVRAAERNRDLAQSLRTRDVTAGVQYDRTPNDAVRNSVGFTLSVPLFTRYYYEGEIRRAEADYDAAVASVERARATALTELGTAAATLDNAAQRVRRFQEGLLNSAEQAAAGAEFAYTRGAIGVMDPLDARRQLHALRLESAAALADYARAVAAWRAATEPVPGNIQ